MSGTVKRPVVKKLKPAKKEEVFDGMTRIERNHKELTADWDMVKDLGTILKEEQVRPPTFIDGSKSRSLNELAEMVKSKIETNFEKKDKIMKARKQRRRGRPTTDRPLRPIREVSEESDVGSLRTSLRSSSIESNSSIGSEKWEDAQSKNGGRKKRTRRRKSKRKRKTKKKKRKRRRKTKRRRKKRTNKR